MKTIYKAALIASVTTLAAMTVHAHHSFAMFDRTTEVVKTGTVQRWAFNNPHSWLYVNVTNEDGTQTLWSFESASPTQLIGRGITGKSFEPGATVTVMFCPLRDGRAGGGIGGSCSRTAGTSPPQTADATAVTRTSPGGKTG